MDDRYLRISSSPLPAGYSDPQGWGRKYIGGMLTSSRAGGSGFSAQYGYFEMRMQAPAGSGTWPGFWMLPAINLATPQRQVAEVDALEYYGSYPRWTCHGTHQHDDGGDVPNVTCVNPFDTVRNGLSWHTYGAQVSPTGITYYVDGQVVATTRRSTAATRCSTSWSTWPWAAAGPSSWTASATGRTCMSTTYASTPEPGFSPGP